MKNKIYMELGESRHVRLQIHSIRNDDFEISSAAYELLPVGAEQPEDEGNPLILEHMIDMVITPQAAGVYQLRVTYTIADEILIDMIEVRVQ